VNRFVTEEKMKTFFKRVAVGGAIAGVAFGLGYVLFRLVLGEVQMSDAYDVEVSEQ
jgi:hypothetical protein